MKTKILVLLFTFSVGVGTLYSQTVISVGAKLSWSLSNGTLTISGNGAMNDFHYSTNKPSTTKESPWYSARASIKRVVINSGVTSIGSSAFFGCSSLTSVTIPNSVTNIGDSAFYNCTGLTSVTIPNSVTSIENKTFYNCSSLTSVTIGNSVTSIGYQAFEGCSGLTSVTIPNSVTSIGYRAFYGCGSLTSVTIGNSVTSIGFKAFFGCSRLTALTIPNSVTSIGDEAFSRCSGLTSVTIGNSVTSIGEWAFTRCSGLTGELVIPNSVTSIGDYAFSVCSGLTSVTIGNSVTSIGDGAFSSCTSLTSITINAETPPALGSSIFYNFNNTNNCPIYVPCGTIDAYTSAWSEYANRIISMQLNYQITGNVNIEGAGSVQLPQYICDDIVIIAVSNYGYHFTKWSDGNTDNRRTIVLTQDTTFTAEFAKNTYTISTTSANPEWGTTAGNTAALYLDEVEISAIPNYGYHFTQWSDGNTDNPRTIVLTQDTTFTAEFAKNSYTISTTSANPEWGTTAGETAALYLDEVEISAVSNYGYHFTKWSDGNTDNRRTIVLTQDTTFTAEFAKNTYTISTTSANPEWGTTAGNTAALYLDEVEISAIPNYGYHFVRWNDNNTSTPRTVTVTEDKTFTATFAKNVYSITKNAGHGSISGNSSAEYLDQVTLSVSSDYGYHFTKWSDGNTDNPRTFVLTQDTTFTAEFAKNTYTISTTSANPEWGTTAGDTAALYLDEIEISAIPNYGYHFVRWNDNNTSTPRTVTVTEDKTFTATFAKNVYSITKNAGHGSISGNSSAEYLDQVTLSVSSDYGYHFTQWSDGNTDNPRTFVLTQDTTFTAEFAVDKSGTCGKNNLLQWTFADDGTLTISGSGELTENYTFGVEAPTQMQTIIIGNEVTAIGERAFYEKTTLQKLIIGSNVTSIGKYAFASINNRQLTSLVMPAELLSIGDYAFSGNTYVESIDFNAKLQSIGAYAFKDCYRVSEMTCLAIVTPDLGTDALASINSYASLCVPAESLRRYQVDPNWGQFDLCELGTTSTVTENRTVTVEPTDNTAIFTWPTENNAASYSLQITKDGVVFCTLVFNSNGQLTGIAFAPGRNGAAHAPAATMSIAGMSFTVTGLNVASKYAYRLAVADDASEELVAYSGEFATTGYDGEVNPGGNPDGIEDVFTDEHKASKILHNGQIYIIRGDKTYTITGQETIVP